jgi:hypothetical protein
MKQTRGGNLQVRDAKLKRRRRNKGMCLEDRPVLEPNAGGIDVGAREMFVAVPPGLFSDSVSRAGMLLS